MWVTGQADAGADRDVVLDRRERSDIAVRLDPHAIAQRAPGLDDGVVLYMTVVADDGVLADEDVAARLESIPDARAIVDRRAAANARIAADLDRARCGVRMPAAKADVVVNEAALANAHVAWPGQRQISSHHSRAGGPSTSASACAANIVAHAFSWTSEA